MRNPVRIIVSDVTYMHGDAICVAGWSETDQRMIRPLQSAGQHWPKEMAGQDRFWPGNVIEFAPSDKRNSRGLPHRNEDTIVRGMPRVIDQIEAWELADRLQPSESPSVHALFRNHLQSDRWVEAGRDCPSLGAVCVATRHVSIFSDYGKPRCRFSDAVGAAFEFAVSSKIVRDAWDEGGAERVAALYETAPYVHLRIGLASPWNKDGEWPEQRAYAMVNGLIPCYV